MVTGCRFSATKLNEVIPRRDSVHLFVHLHVTLWSDVLLNIFTMKRNNPLNMDRQKLSCGRYSLIGNAMASFCI